MAYPFKAKEIREEAQGLQQCSQAPKHQPQLSDRKKPGDRLLMEVRTGSRILAATTGPKRRPHTGLSGIAWL